MTKEEVLQLEKELSFQEIQEVLERGPYEK